MSVASTASDRELERQLVQVQVQGRALVQAEQAAKTQEEPAARTLVGRSGLFLVQSVRQLFSVSGSFYQWKGWDMEWQLRILDCSLVEDKYLDIQPDYSQTSQAGS